MKLKFIFECSKHLRKNDLTVCITPLIGIFTEDYSNYKGYNHPRSYNFTICWLVFDFSISLYPKRNLK